MLGAAYAAVPIYRLICQATGLGGTTQRAERSPGPVLERTIRVRFDANLAPGLAWEFKARQPVVEVRFGETVLAHYEAASRGAKRTAGTATYNVAPEIAGRYFSKIECFCFTEQALDAGQRVDMPVTFFVDPAMLEDKDAAHLTEITLSYSFFPVEEGKSGLASQSGAAPPAAVPQTRRSIE
jgi:cytochrome c oxidase assembly protein subunit 11